MKTFMTFVLTLTLCTHWSLALTDQEIEQFDKFYNDYQEIIDTDLRGIPMDVFKKLNRSTLMQRISNYEGWLGVGTSSFVIKATYQPLSGDPFAASIKIIPDFDNFTHFDANLIMAKLTGDVMVDKYNPERKAAYSYDDAEGRAEVNINPEHRNPYAANINPFYEMQKVTVEYKETEESIVKPYYFTVVVSGVGERNLSDEPIFKKDSDKNQNTTHFLNYCLDIARAARNMNAQGYLHGDIKPDNMILVPSNGDYKIEFVDFDLIFDPDVHENPCYQERYSPLYRAPWIQPTSTLVGYNRRKKPIYEDLFPYDPKLTEDSFAIAISIDEIF
jgi:serine/threonine protein kinase